MFYLSLHEHFAKNSRKNTQTQKYTISHVHMFVLVTYYTLRKIMSAHDQGIIAVTGRAHCQRQVAFFNFISWSRGSIWEVKISKNSAYPIISFFSAGGVFIALVNLPSRKSTHHGLTNNDFFVLMKIINPHTGAFFYLGENPRFDAFPYNCDQKWCVDLFMRVKDT